MKGSRAVPTPWRHRYGVRNQSAFIPKRMRAPSPIANTPRRLLLQGLGLATEFEGGRSSTVLGTRLCVDMDKYLRVVYPRAFVLHSLLHQHYFSATTNSGCEYKIPPPLVLQSPIITSVARERHSVWSSDSVTDVCTEPRDRSRNPSEAPGWLSWQYGLSQLKSVPSVGYLHGRRTTLVTWLKSSVRETEQDRSTVFDRSDAALD